MHAPLPIGEMDAPGLSDAFVFVVRRCSRTFIRSLLSPITNYDVILMRRRYVYRKLSKAAHYAAYCLTLCLECLANFRSF